MNVDSTAPAEPPCNLALDKSKWLVMYLSAPSCQKMNIPAPAQLTTGTPSSMILHPSESSRLTSIGAKLLVVSSESALFVVNSFAPRHQDQRPIARLSLAAGATSRQPGDTPDLKFVEKDAVGCDNAAMVGSKWNKGGGEAWMREGG
mmetsp:Transcript_10733/g.17426  ORF Transcript_10733/g.17426 Transcript_10733/m.17426 type:complete len:147 (-) Transcript_10733:16-456(-)